MKSRYEWLKCSRRLEIAFFVCFPLFFPAYYLGKLVVIAWLIVEILLFILPIYIRLKYWRCPKCDRLLSNGTLFEESISVCPYCGQRLEVNPNIEVDPDYLE